MNTHTSITSMNVKQLKELCNEYKLTKTGKKADLIARITEYTRSLNVVDSSTDDVTNTSTDDVFETKIWPAYSSWWSKHEFELVEQVENFKWEKVSYEKIRDSFMNYDYTKSDLRKDSLVPIPKTIGEEFIEMFFEKIGQEWDNPQDKDGEEWDECSQQDFINIMKVIA